MAKRRSKKALPPPGLGILRVLVAALLLGLLGYFLKDFYGISYRWVGSYIWIFAFIIWFVIGFFYLAEFTLPLRWYESWYEGLGLILSYNFPFIFGGSAYDPKKVSEKKNTVEGLPDSFARHGAGILESHKAVAINRGPTYTRSAGPGYVTMNRGERVSQVVDLRRHVRSMTVEALTHDGIPVETSVSAVFEVRRDDDPADPGIPYPYDFGAIFNVNYANSLNTGAGSLYWSERLAREASRRLVTEISAYSLDDLERKDELDPSPMEQIGKRLNSQLKQEFQQHGISVVNIGVGSFKLPDDVSEQRIMNWQAEWEKRIQGEKAAGDAEALRQIALARARAQIEIISRITERIEAMRASGEAELTDVVALRMIEAMEEAVADDKVRDLVPQQAIGTLRQIQSWMNDRSGES
jgi:regulator of protease activity HflC (stomatin/prohibitin superfamily)